MLRALILTCCLMAAPAFAEDAILTIAQDRYQAGASVRFTGPEVQDLFMAGNRFPLRPDGARPRFDKEPA